MEEVRLDERDGILLVTLNRPAVRNAIDEALSRGYAEALAQLDRRDDLAAAVVTGAGGSFCAGMDLRAFADAAASAPALARVVRATTAKPLIAAVEGFAVGGGLELALTCDLIVAARDARLGLPEVRHSLVPAGGGLVRLPERLPAGVALELALTGDLLDAPRLHALGLVNRLAEPGGALEAALAMAARIAANGPLAVAGSRRIVREALASSGAPAWALQDAVVGEVNGSADAREGVRAFAEKRSPVWTGR